MTASIPEFISGRQLRDAFAAGAAWLERHVESVNAINVFPVPDGDTGTNMYLTMSATLEEAERCQDEDVGSIMAALSHGALMGARGNSGVILSQIIRGMARSTDGLEALDGDGLVRGFEEGSAVAYKAVTKPTEGTILTVIRESAEAARESLKGGQREIGGLLEVAVAAARESVARTPTLLPVLAEAGVVDAGGQGLYILLEGVLRGLKGEAVDGAVDAGGESVGRDWLAVTEQIHGIEESLYGYCTEILVEGDELKPDALRERMQALGDSVLVVGTIAWCGCTCTRTIPGRSCGRGPTLALWCR